MTRPPPPTTRSRNAPKASGIPDTGLAVAPNTTSRNLDLPRRVVSEEGTLGPDPAKTSPARRTRRKSRGGGTRDAASAPTDQPGPQLDPESSRDRASDAGPGPLDELTGADLTGQAAPTPAEGSGNATHSTAGTQPAQSRGAVRALAEATLVTRAQDGDVAAFERLARSYNAELVRLGYRMLSDLGEAQDAVQDTLLVAWRKLPAVDDPAAFHAWVYQLMTRRCLNLLRRRARQRTVVAPDADLEVMQRPVSTSDTGDGPAARAQTEAMRDGLTLALAGLSAELRACWVLHSLHHLSYPEIAYAIGVPVSTVRGRIAHARVQLVKEMSAWQ